MPALTLVGVASGRSARSVIAPRSRRIHFVPGAAERVAADHVAEHVDDVAADERPRGHDQEGDDAEADRDRPVGRRARAHREREEEQEERHDHERRVERGARPGGAVGVRVVGGAGRRRPRA